MKEAKMCFDRQTASRLRPPIRSLARLSPLVQRGTPSTFTQSSTMCLCGRAPTVCKSWRSRISSSGVQRSIQARFWTYESQGRRVLSPGPYGRGSPYNPSNLLHERLRIVTRCMSKNWRISSIERGESRRLRVRWHPPTGTTVPTSSTRE